MCERQRERVCVCVCVCCARARWPGFACFFELVREMCLRGCDVELEAGLIVCAGVGVSVV